MTVTAGLDLSNNQPQTINWAQVKAAGYQFLWHKISEGVSYVDPYIDGRKARRTDDAQAAGLIAGGYHFARPGASEPEQQADLFLAHLPAGCLLRPVCDFEATKLDVPGTCRWAERFMAHLETAGTRPVFYTYSGFAQSWLAGAQLSQYDLWLANYRTTPPPPPAPWPTYLAWQHADDGNVPGAGTPIDLNVTNDLDALRVTPAAPPPVQEQDVTVAHFIVHAGHPGLWLAAPQIEPIAVANTDVAVYVAFASGLRIDPPPAGAVTIDKPNSVAGSPQKCWSVDDAGAAYFHLPTTP